MALYYTSDFTTIKNNFEKIQRDISLKRQELALEPTLAEKKQIQTIILNFAKTNNRKIYGGYALDMVIKHKNESDAIYTKEQVSDIDIYSPEPIVDMMKLCNIIYNSGFKCVIGKEAMHPETYCIFVNNILHCDITYVPKNIYNKMGTFELCGLTLIHTVYMHIDYLKILTDPLVSYWRLGDDLKGLKRFMLLEKYYPLPNSKHPIVVQPISESRTCGLAVISLFIFDKTSLVVLGTYAYNCFLRESRCFTKFNYLAIPYYEFISTNYKADFHKLMSMLKPLGHIHFIEYQPFFQYFGNRVEIFLNGELIVKIYCNNNKAIPYIDYKMYSYNDTFIRIGSFQMNILHCLINTVYGRVNSYKSLIDDSYAMTHNLLDMRNFFFETTKLSVMDDSVFKDFIIDCVGSTLTPEMHRKNLINSRKKYNHKLTMVYEPTEQSANVEPVSNYKFANNSGNELFDKTHSKLIDVVIDTEPTETKTVTNTKNDKDTQ